MTKSDLMRLEQPALAKLIDDGKLVEVVRCGECKLFSPRISINFCGKTGSGVKETDYCSYGERIESEGK